jgi:hypothetical protein
LRHSAVTAGSIRKLPLDQACGSGNESRFLVKSCVKHQAVRRVTSVNEVRPMKSSDGVRIGSFLKRWRLIRAGGSASVPPSSDRETVTLLLPTIFLAGGFFALLGGDRLAVGQALSPVNCGDLKLTRGVALLSGSAVIATSVSKSLDVLGVGPCSDQPGAAALLRKSSCRKKPAWRRPPAE